eukprot:Skav229609  [mRNA]  locus=scaffold510:259604:260836:+ [translate_table: standard]
MEDSSESEESSDDRDEDAIHESIAEEPQNDDADSAAQHSEDGEASGSPDELRELATALAAEGAQLLRKGELPDAQNRLLRGQALLERVEATSDTTAWTDAQREKRRTLAVLQAEVAGNLGICYRRLKDFGQAIHQLQLALKFREMSFENSERKVEAADLRTLVAAHLNLASCHLESEAPEAALKHASTAAQLSGQVLTRATDSLGEVEPTENDFAMLAVSFHKVAEAHEALKEWGRAIFAHTQAREVVQRSLGSTHPLAQSLARCRPQVPSRSPPPSRQSNGSGNGPSNVRAEFLDVYAANIGRSTGCPMLRKGKVLPTIPRGARGKAFKTEAKGPLGFELSGYEISEDDFPTWPPKTASSEEKEWYAMARALRHEAPPLPKLAIKQEPVVDNFPAIPPPSRGSRRSRQS